MSKVNARLASDEVDTVAQVNWQAPWYQHLSCQSLISLPTLPVAQAQQTLLINNPSVNDTEDNGSILSVAAHLNGWREHLAANRDGPLITGRGQPLRFVAQEALPEGMAYESFIADTGNVPTRDNLHDLFNGSIWLTFPKSKALLNRYQAQEIDRAGISGRRGRIRDTITVFDENGAVLVTSVPAIGEALASFDWQHCLVQPRDSWDNPFVPADSASAAVYIVGHALLEQLVEPRKPLCAHTLIINVDPSFFSLSAPERLAYLDELLLQRLSTLLADETVTPRALSPLPILGVPHYWSDNADPEFYNDSYVFRSGRRRQ